MKRMVTGALIAWCGIVWLAYRLADARIALCMPYNDAHLRDIGCQLRATAARDSTLTWGPSVALIAIIAAYTLLGRRVDRAQRLIQ